MKSRAKISLAGGGGEADSRLLDKVFASWLGPQGRLLYWPVALRGIRSFESCLGWVTATFAPWHITRITMWTDLTEHRGIELDKFDAVYIGGGNTYALLAELIQSGFDHDLKAYADAGGIVYGGSAGAVVLGKDIRTVSHMDQNLVNLIEVNGLNLIQDHSVWPHYQSALDHLIEDFVRARQQPVLAIPERSGIIADSGLFRVVGFEPSYCFDHRGKTAL